MREPLTGRQAEVLAMIGRHWREHGQAPTVRELGERLGMRSVCTVQRHLERLEAKGLITRQPGRARTVRPVEQSGEDFRQRVQRLVEFLTGPIINEQKHYCMACEGTGQTRNAIAHTSWCPMATVAAEFDLPASDFHYPVQMLEVR